MAAIPEEIVRQRLIQKMVSELGYPKNLIAVEKEIGSLPDQREFPKRRLDLVSYANSERGVIPLLLAECKSVPLDEAAVRQVFGYNASVHAPFICLASESEIKTLWMEKGKIASIPFLPPFAELRTYLINLNNEI